MLLKNLYKNYRKLSWRNDNSSNKGKKIGGQDPVYPQGAVDIHRSHMQGENPYHPPHRRDEGTLVNNRVGKTSPTRETSTPERYAYNFNPIIQLTIYSEMSPKGRRLRRHHSPSYWSSPH